MTLVVGASGATGRLVVEELLKRDEKVKVVVRSFNNLPKTFDKNKNLTIIHGNVLDFNEAKLKEILKECKAVVSCLGHNMTFKGIYGKPQKLVRDTIIQLCLAIESNKPLKPVKLILMNTSGNSNRDINETISFAQKCIISLIRLLLPPHVDNEQAADYLRTIKRDNKTIQWVAVRPDGLTHEKDVSPYEIHISPIRSAIFDAGKTSRINVANFMGQLITDENTWQQYRGQMPVIYNKSS